MKRPDIDAIEARIKRCPLCYEGRPHSKCYEGTDEELTPLLAYVRHLEAKLRGDPPAYPKPKEMYYDVSAFCDGHKGASEIIARLSDGFPLAAVYYFPPGTHAAELRSFFKKVQAENELRRLDDYEDQE